MCGHLNAELDGKELNTLKPEATYQKMTNYPVQTRKTKTDRKVATYKIQKSQMAQSSLLARATSYNSLSKELTLINNSKFFTKALKKYLANNTKLPDMKLYSKNCHRKILNKDDKGKQPTQPTDNTNNKLCSQYYHNTTVEESTPPPARRTPPPVMRTEVESAAGRADETTTTMKLSAETLSTADESQTTAKRTRYTSHL